jgi:hypothetical protein
MPRLIREDKVLLEPDIDIVALHATLQAGRFCDGDRDV